MTHHFRYCMTALWALGACAPAAAQLVINDTLNGASSSYDWRALNGACLTAGDNTGTIPACVGLPYYAGKTHVGGTTGRLPDAPGYGALRLTNGDFRKGTNGNNQTGAVVSNFMFPSTQGLQVTFTTVTYGGNAYGGYTGVQSGADGISFFLADAGTLAAPKAPTVGAPGGSLGYACSNGNMVYSDGVAGGYIGIGIDEFGNFANAADSTHTGDGYKPGRISLRGAGNVAWASLNAAYPTLYPASATAANKLAAVQNTCKTGLLWNYSGGNVVDATGATVANLQKTGVPVPFNYPHIASSLLPSNVTLYSQQGIDSPKRGAATPVTYTLKITQNGILNLGYSINGGSINPVLTDRQITASNGPLPANFRFGFSASTGDGSNVHEVTCFKAAPAAAANSSAGANSPPTGRTQQGNQAYSAYYQPLSSSGGLTSTTVNVDTTTGALSLAPTPNWDAGCVLTGGACATTGAASVTAQAPSARAMLTWNGTAGAPFEWANLTTPQQASLTAGDAASTDLRLRYLRGDRSNEVANAGTLRTRTGVLGDIVNSSPTWVGPPSAKYPNTWTDALYPAATALETSYATFASTNAGRTNLVFAGANDGFLHGFRAGVYSGGVFQEASTTTPNDGRELIAYMPAAVLSTIHSTTPALDFSSPQYSHNFYVDATPATGDLFYNGAWHTWLVGGAGHGGNATGPIGNNTSVANGILFALDVTDPAQFSQTNAASLVIGEWTSSTLTCVDGACGSHLGSTVGTPLIRRLHNGDWAVLFGNGLNSASGDAGLYVMLVDRASGARSFRYLPTGAGPTTAGGVTTRNGIAHLSSVDLDGDRITDYVYAGDVFGNLWRFDLTSNLPANWAVTPGPMFRTASGRPITTKPQISAVPSSGPNSKPRLIVSFGTGQQFPQTLTSAASYASGSQALYGIWDWNLGAWNAVAPATAKYASLVAPQTITAAGLTAQSVISSNTASTPATRSVSSKPICWADMAVCTGISARYGWTLPLPSAAEQTVYNPTFVNGVFIVNTVIPGIDNPLSCNAQAAAGWTMAVSVANGGATPKSFFVNSPLASGIAIDGVGGLVPLSTQGQAAYQPRTVLISADKDGDKAVIEVNAGATGVGSRVNWAQLR
ncbi:MAG: PilC/PilY family type IV pilus protein [Pseudomonadota bacterium]